MRKLICLSHVIFFLLFFALSGSASPVNEDNQLLALDSSRETVNELLLFWDEKDLYVQTATRYQKPISQVAENITVVTAKEIEDMNAHTVSEVLNRVTGVFVDFQGQNFGGPALLHIQGSSERHVLVMIDGVRWNFLNSGSAETNTIPVQIIDRIEIIKGPASSAWGSSLGGVINIITKEPGDNKIPSGTLSGSYGEANSQDYRGEVSGKAGPLGYYLFAGYQDSNGLSDNRFFRNYSVYSKFRLPVSEDVKLGFTFGYSEPRIGFGDIPSADITSHGKTRTLFGTLSLSALLSRELTFDLSIYEFNQKFGQFNDVLSTGDLFEDLTFTETTTSGTAKLVWKHDIHTVVLGTDISHGSLDQTLTLGPFLQSFGLPASMTGSPDENRWAVFINDTITLGKFSITPGVRYDHNSVSGSLASPSLGLTYKPAERTILRASVARGFNSPPLAFTSLGGLFFDPNPGLGPEKVWSYQAGIESGLTDYLWIKGTLFYHDVTDAIVTVAGADRNPPSDNSTVVNDGSLKRKGFELEAETAPLYNLSLKAGFSLVKSDTSIDGTIGNSTFYQYNVSLKYDDRKSFMAQLFGHYVWWNLSGDDNAKYNGFIFDLDLKKKIYSTDKTITEVFMTAHNIFNGSQYTLGDFKNPRRWVEAGLRFKF